jgi:hypothetical protein
MTESKVFITGKKLAYLTAFLNSNVFKICYRDNFPGIEDLISEDFDTFVKDVQNGKDYADLRLGRALIFALELRRYEDYITNYKI